MKPLLLGSASTSDRSMACPAWLVLPHFATLAGDAALQGTVVHSFLEGTSLAFARLQQKQLVDKTTTPVEDLARAAAREVLPSIPERWRPVCSRVQVEKLPLGLGFRPEQAFAYDVVTMRARQLTNEGRDYDVGPNEIPMRIDTHLVDGDVVYTFDFKTGWIVRPVRELWQIKLNALALRAHYGASVIRASIARVPDKGDPWFDSTEFDDLDLDSFALELATLPGRVQAARQQVVPVTVSGDHCEHCPALRKCPQQTALVALFAGDDAGAGFLEAAKRELTPEKARKAYLVRKQIGRLLADFDAVIEVYAAEHDIDLGDGMVYGRYVSARQTVTDGNVVFEVVRSLHGEDVAKRSVTMKSSKTAIEDAVRPLRTNAQPIKRMVAQIMSDVVALGGAENRPTVSVKEHKKRELGAGEDGDE